MRAEVRAQASVRWSFRPTGDPEFSNLFFYENEAGQVLDERFLDRLVWRGSNRTWDLQDGSIFILNVSHNDSGTYRCVFDRRLLYDGFEFLTNTTKVIQLHVVPQFSRGMASILSEVMMYVSIVGLQLWLLVEMIYCYRKISAAGEEALRESATDYLAIASESKENCAAEPPPE
ncbi:sodium channel regulatory subunit beta-1-like isoform 2-T2 [Menidia menidia]